MVRRSVLRHEIAPRWQCFGRRKAGGGFGGVREPEESDAVAIADVEEEVLAASAGQVERLHQRHAARVAVEFDRLRHILAHECEVVDTAHFDFAIFCSRSEEHKSELQSLIRSTYAVFFLKQK